MKEDKSGSIRGHQDFSIKNVAAESIGQASRGLDDLFKGQGYFYLIDEGPYADNPEFKTFLFATWSPVPYPDMRSNA